MPLLNDTRALLDKAIAAGHSMGDIAAKSNGTVDYEWLRKFHQRKGADPSVTRVEALFDRLKLLQPFRRKNAA